MLVVETIGKIRRAFFQQKKAIKSISPRVEGLAEGDPQGESGRKTQIITSS